MLLFTWWKIRRNLALFTAGKQQHLSALDAILFFSCSVKSTNEMPYKFQFQILANQRANQFQF